MSYSRLYRSTTSRVFGGVAGGIAEFFSIDPVIIRILFVLAAIFGGGGVIIYLVLWIAVPERPYTATMFTSANPSPEGPDSEKPAGEGTPPQTNFTQGKYSGSLIGGIILIGIGAMILAGRIIPNVYFRDLWPFFLVVAGVILIVNSMNTISKKDS